MDDKVNEILAKEIAITAARVRSTLLEIDNSTEETTTDLEETIKFAKEMADILDESIDDLFLVDFVEEKIKIFVDKMSDYVLKEIRHTTVIGKIMDGLFELWEYFTCYYCHGKWF